MTTVYWRDPQSQPLIEKKIKYFSRLCTPHPLSKTERHVKANSAGGRLISISQHIFTIGNNGGASAQAPHLSQKTGALLSCGQI